MIYIFIYPFFKFYYVLLGFSIPLNVFGLVLHIYYGGTVIVLPKTEVGKNCKLNAIVQSEPWPERGGKIGDNCYSSPGVKILGGIVTGNNVTIGTNLGVVKSFPDNAVIAGVSAKIINKHAT